MTSNILTRVDRVCPVDEEGRPVHDRDPEVDPDLDLVNNDHAVLALPDDAVGSCNKWTRVFNRGSIKFSQMPVTFLEVLDPAR